MVILNHLFFEQVRNFGILLLNFHFSAYWFPAHHLSFMLIQDSRVLIEEAFEPPHQEIAHVLEQDIFVITKELGDSCLNHLVNLLHMCQVYVHVMVSVFKHSIKKNRFSSQ